MHTVFTAITEIEAKVAIANGAGWANQFAGLSSLSGDVNRIDLFREDGKGPLRRRRLMITDGDRPWTPALTGSDHSDLTSPQVQHDPGVNKLQDGQLLRSQGLHQTHGHKHPSSGCIDPAQDP